MLLVAVAIDVVVWVSEQMKEESTSAGYHTNGFLEGLNVLMMILTTCSIDAYLSYWSESKVNTLFTPVNMVEVVRHNGDVDIVSQKELLVGYIIKVNPGMKIPADSILIQCDVEDGILCNESEVTGTNGAQHKVSSD